MTAPVLSRSGTTYTPAPEAKGPFPGQHGGAVGGALAHALESHAAAMLESFEPANIQVLLLRPAPMEPVEIDVEELRAGGRSAAFAARMHRDGRLFATATATFLKPVPGLGVRDVAPPDAPFDPLPLDRMRISRVQVVDGEQVPWFSDISDMRPEPATGRLWIRLERPLTEPFTPFVRAVALADWTSGPLRPDGWREPVFGGFPNADLTLHFWRPMEGEWIGLEAESGWRADGTGLTATKLYDMRGWFGRCAQSIILLPLPKD
jgi:hypothetical protein